MNLHHTNGISDWHSISPRQRNQWQRIAAASYGIVTPANLVSIVGFGAVLLGLVALMQGAPWLGIGLIVAGRLADICDGWVADLTGTKSRVGEMLDATLDKCAVVIVLLALFWLELLPFYVMIVILIANVVLALIGVVARVAHVSLHPNRAGKLNGFALWGALPLYAAAAYLGGMLEAWTYGIATAIIAFSVVLASIAAIQYSMMIIITRRTQEVQRS